MVDPTQSNPEINSFKANVFKDSFNHFRIKDGRNVTRSEKDNTVWETLIQ